MANANKPGVGEALVLTCMDLRVTDDIARFLATESGGKDKAWWELVEKAPENLIGKDGAKLDKLADEYDHISLAGAALAAVNDFPAHDHFRKSIWNHIGLANHLHQVKRLVIVEHQDCGAYKYFVAPRALGSVVGAKDGNAWKNPVEEASLHWLVASALKASLLELQSDWTVDILYATLPDPSSLHGSVRAFTPEERSYKLAGGTPATVKPNPEWLDPTTLLRKE